MGLFKRRRTGEEPEFRPSDILALIVAALQVILPFVAILLLAALLVFGLFLLLFH